MWFKLILHSKNNKIWKFKQKTLKIKYKSDNSPINTQN